MTPADSLPDPRDARSLPQENQWVEMHGAASQRTAPHGDWSVFPHMQNKDSWKERMGSRAQLVDNFLQQRSICVDGCMMCKDHGVGHPGNWSAHIASQRHFKIFGQKICTDECGRNRNIDEVLETAWETWILPGGALAFNHADGRIWMFRGGSPPPLNAQARAPVLDNANLNQYYGYAPTAAPSTAGSMYNGQAPGPGSMINGQAPMAGPGTGNGFAPPGNSFAQPAAVSAWPGGTPAADSVKLIEKCPQENRWFKFYPPVGMPHQKDGDYNSCPWLTSKNMWKAAMGDRANVMREILTQYEIAPICPYCPQAGDFPGHLPAQKHYQALCNAKLVAGKRIIDISKECYQTWTVPGGIIRFNHISGEIAACRGTAPSMMERALALEGQHLQQALPAFPASGNPAAVPPEYPTPAASSQQPYPTAGNQAVPPEYPTAGNPAATAEYPTAGYPAAFAPAPAPSQIPAQMPVQAQHHPAATPNFGLGPTSAPPQHGETMGAYPGYMAHYWNLEAPPFQPGHQESFPEVAPGAWQPPEAAAGHQEAPVFGTPAQEPANGFDQGAARHAATAPAAKTMPSEEQLEFMYWMWKNCVSRNREETKRSLSLMALASDELECVMCGVEDFSSIDQMLDHFSSREHFEELVKQSSYPRVPQKPFQQQFGNGRWELDLWTLELSETESQAQQGGESPIGLCELLQRKKQKNGGDMQ